MAKTPAKAAGGRQMICHNRRAAHHYSLGERLEAGLALVGTEVKACRAGKAHLNDAYVAIRGSEAFLLNAHIAPYEFGNILNHEPTRTRKLLLHRQEIDKLASRIKERGASVIPTMLYFKDGRVKVEIALASGKTHEDRRAAIKEKETARDLQRTMQRARRRAGRD